VRFSVILTLACVLALVGCTTSERSSPTEKNQKSQASAVQPSGNASDPKEASQQALPTYADAARYLSAGEVDKAITVFESIVKRNPGDIESQVQFARLLISAGRLPEARSVLERVLAQAPDNRGAQYSMALLEGASGNDAKELTLLEGIVSRYPADAEANASLGQIYLGRNDTEKARAAFTRSLKADPNNIAALLGEGEILLNVDSKPKEALADFDRAVKLQPELSLAYADRAEAEVGLNDVSGAEKDFTKAISLNPGYYWHYIDRGKLRLVFEHDRKGALADFNEAVKLEPGYFLGYIYRGGVYDELGDRAAAMADYQKLLSLRPDYYFVYRPYAVLLYEQKDWSRAREYFLKTFKADPTDFGPEFLAVITYLKQGNKVDATALLTRLAGELPQSSLFYALARLYLEPGSDTSFLAKLQAERNPDVRTRMLFYLACFYELHGKTELAQRYFFDVQARPVEGMYEYKLNEAELQNYKR